MNQEPFPRIARMFAIATLVACAALGVGACSNGNDDGDASPVDDTEEPEPIETDTTHLTCTALLSDPDAASPTRALVDRVVAASQGLSATDLDANLELIGESVAEGLEDEFDVIYSAIRATVVDGAADALAAPEVDAAIVDIDAWAATECTATDGSDSDDVDG